MNSLKISQISAELNDMLNTVSYKVYFHITNKEIIREWIMFIVLSCISVSLHATEFILSSGNLLSQHTYDSGYRQKEGQ